jgi:putative ABC transport system permease protein
MLGIIIGIASIIAILAVGKGAEERVKKEILAAGDNYIYISPGNWFAEEKSKKIKRSISAFYQQDIDMLKKYIDQIKRISPTGYSREIISARGNTVNSEVKSGNEQLLAITGRKIARGQFFVTDHITTGARVAVLGHKAAFELFKNANPLGQIIQIKKSNFTVIGVIKQLDQQLGFGTDPNMDIFIPYTTAKKFNLAPKGAKINGICMSIKSLQETPAAVRQIKKIMRAQRHISTEEPDDFTVWDQASMLKAAKTSSAVLNLLLLIIASIALLVGGIGVMNIMLVSVGERTKEIGIRMALGARTNIILRQFLSESIILCILGGILGIGVGCLMPYIISNFTGWIVIISPISIILAIVAIFCVGIIFGFYPAHTASRLNPVEALVEQ